MAVRQTINSISFRNYKAFRRYGLTLHDFNVLVGPNNAGKSTIIGALRILSEGIRKARAKNPEWVEGAKGKQKGYAIELKGLPVSTENVFHDYDESEPAVVTFRTSTGDDLILLFPEKGVCNLFVNSQQPARSPAEFRRVFDIKLSFVPVLGPVEHDEKLYKGEAARLALLSHNASRNFRNIWHHFREGFAEFRETIRATWPGMDIEFPELIESNDGSFLRMFCPEDRVPREIFWAGFGFQVWCQMLTFILQAKDASLLVIDEPDIYLHSDLQRQLVGIVRELGPRVILATHSTEIISEVEADSILNINKRFDRAKRIRNSEELHRIFSALGSNLNPILTQLAKTRRAIFVEGKDFQLLGRFARRMNLKAVANRADFAVVPIGGFNPHKLKDFALGMELTLGSKLLKLVVFDRDYRSAEEADNIEEELREFCDFAVVHPCKEIENYVLVPHAVEVAINRRIREREVEGAPQTAACTNMEGVLMELSETLKSQVLSQQIDATQRFKKKTAPGINGATVSKQTMEAFEAVWPDFEHRMKIVPGKELLSLLNGYVQKEFKVSVTAGQIIDAMRPDEVPDDIQVIVRRLESCRRELPDDSPTGRDPTP